MHKHSSPPSAKGADEREDSAAILGRDEGGGDGRAETWQTEFYTYLESRVNKTC